MATITMARDATTNAISGTITTTTTWTSGTARDFVIFNESEKPVKVTLSGNGATTFAGLTINNGHDDELIIERNEFNVEGATGLSIRVVPTGGSGVAADTATFTCDPLHTGSGMVGDTILMQLRTPFASSTF